MTANVIVNDCPQPPVDGEPKVPWVHEYSLDEIYRFGDFKCLGGSYGMTVNVIVNDYPQPPADGEPKVPWVHEHSLGEFHHRYEDEVHAA